MKLSRVLAHPAICISVVACALSDCATKLAGTVGGRDGYRNYSEDVERFDQAMLEMLHVKHGAQGWWLTDWYITRKCSLDESSAARTA